DQANSHGVIPLPRLMAIVAAAHPRPVKVTPTFERCAMTKDIGRRRRAMQETLDLADRLSAEHAHRSGALKVRQGSGSTAGHCDRHNCALGIDMNASNDPEARVNSSRAGIRSPPGRISRWTAGDAEAPR